MKIELIIIIITGVLIFNLYHDNKYFEIIKSWKKYYQMILIGLVGITLIILIRKNPKDTKSLLYYTNNLIKFLPINKEYKNLIDPLISNPDNNLKSDSKINSSKILNSGGNSNKRSVGETKKKYVASKQNWICKGCNTQLEAWFEIDHVIRLENGGSNHIDNLVALCRNCHGKKTAMENMNL